MTILVAIITMPTTRFSVFASALLAIFAAILAQKQGWKTTLVQAKSFVFGSLAEVAVIGKNLQAMYPPVEDYDDLVSITEYA